MITVKVFAEGDQVCAMIGANLQEGIAGFGEKVPDALKALAVDVEKNPMTLVVLILREMSTQLQERRGERRGDGGDEHVVQNVVKSNAGDEKPAPPKAGMRLPNINERKLVDSFIRHVLPQGLCCQKCGSGFVDINKRNPRRYKCKSCGKSQSTFNDTIFAHSQQSLPAWAAVIHMVMTTEDEITARQVQKRMGIAYETAQNMLEKINISLAEEGCRRFFEDVIRMIKDGDIAIKPMARLSI